MRHPPLQAPLLWQLCLCFWIGGIAAAVWPWQSLLCLLLLVLADRRLWKAGRIAFCILLALAGLFTARWQLYGSPWAHDLSAHAPPPWLAEAPKDLRVCGTVTDSQGLPDQRLRLILAHMIPDSAKMTNAAADATANKATTTGATANTTGAANAINTTGVTANTTGAATNAAGAVNVPNASGASPHLANYQATPATPLPGLVALTWEHPTLRPLPGQTFCLTRRPMPMQSFANLGQSTWDLWWAAQNVHWRLWTQAERADPQVSGQGGRSARWREILREKFLAALQAPALWGDPPFAPQNDKQPALTADTAPGTQAKKSSGEHVASARQAQAGHGTLSGHETQKGSEAPPDSQAQASLEIPSGREAPPAPESLSQGKAIVLALLFGDRQFLDQATLNNFAAATLVHSLALSGQHLVVAGMIGLICVLAASRLRPGMYLRRPKILWVMLASLPPALAYLWLGNAPASLLRATVMMLVVALWMATGRPRTTLDALAAALLCITISFPLSVLDTGLQLSALCVGVIGLSLPWMRRIIPLPDHGAPGSPLRLPVWLRALARIFFVSLFIQVALLPLNMLLFGNAGFWFPLNVAWLPMADLIVLPSAVLGLLCAALGLELPARLILDVAAMPCQWLVDCLAWLAENGLLSAPAMLRPHWTALPAFAALLTALAFMAGRKSLPAGAMRLLMAGGVLLMAGPLLRVEQRLSPEIRLDVLDVGQSQAVSLRLPGHVRLLLDGGGSPSPRFDPGQDLVAPALLYNDAPRLAAVFNSHPDLDHMGGLVHILGHFKVNALFDNGQDGRTNSAWGELWTQTRRQHKARPLAQGDVLQLSDPARQLQLEILHPPRSALTEENSPWTGNNASLVARLTHKGRGLALIPGDAERRALRHMLDQGLDLRADVLVLPHHGSDSSYLADFYRAVQPRVAVAACGLENRYGYPGKKVRAWLDKAQIPLLFTGRDGQVRLTWPHSGPAVPPNGATPNAATPNGATPNAATPNAATPNTATLHIQTQRARGQAGAETEAQAAPKSARPNRASPSPASQSHVAPKDTVQNK